MLPFQRSPAAYNSLDKDHISHKLKTKSLNVKAYSENLPGSPVKETLPPDSQDPNKQRPVKIISQTTLTECFLVSVVTPSRMLLQETVSSWVTVSPDGAVTKSCS